MNQNNTDISMMLITSDLAAVVGQPSRMASCFIRVMLAALLLALSYSNFAADFTLEDTQGNILRLADYRGKWVLVNFWATWCHPCLDEIPDLIRLHNEHHDKDLLVIGIAMQSGTRKKVADFVQAHGISYSVVISDRKVTAQLGEVQILPASYLYNPLGELVSFQTGEVTRASVEGFIKK
jgi:peroxiredoxin